MAPEGGIAQLVVSTVFGAMAIILVILRLICRPPSKPSLGIDDYMIVVALVFGLDITPPTAEKLTHVDFLLMLGRSDNNKLVLALPSLCVLAD